MNNQTHLNHQFFVLFEGTQNFQSVLFLSYIVKINNKLNVIGN